VVSTSEDRRKHLEFIQATIARQASHAFAIKGWSLTVAAAIYAYTAANLSCWLAVVACMPAIAFAWLDLFYLRQERLFRELYRDASQPESTVPVFDMDTSPYQTTSKYPQSSYRNVAKSRAWWPLHVMIVGVGIVLLGVAIFQ
jgi:hypothetical protein